MKPVYVVNGFLDSGKSEFISFTLEQPYFHIKGKTLIILCEEGEVEFDPKVLNKGRAIIERISNEEDFNPNMLIDLEKKHDPERILIEYNGMWNYKNAKLPFHWNIEQQITIIDGSTFPMYYTNMRSLLAEMIRKSEMIIFNRCDGIEELNNYKRNIKAVNPSAEVIFEDANGEIDEIFEDDLPYDLNQEVITLDNNGYGIWFLDSMERLDRYLGKTIEFTAMVLKPEEFPKGYFVPGRMAMTCCADDMAFLGYTCKYDGVDSLKEKEWVKVKGTVAKEYWEDYNGEGPVIHAISVTKTSAPEDEIITFM